MLAKMGALEHQAEQTWTSHHVALLNEMKIVAGDALDNQRRILQNLEGIQDKATRSARISAGCSAPFVRSSTRSPSPTGCE